MRILGGDPNPRMFDYPSVYIYFVAGLFALYYFWGLLSGRFSGPSAFAEAFRDHWEPFFLLARGATALMGTLSVGVVHLIAAPLFGTAAGLLSALFLSGAFLHVRDSHYATTDVPLTSSDYQLGQFKKLERGRDYDIDEVAEDYEGLRFNTAISKLMELTNAIIRARETGLAGSDAYAEAVEVLLKLMAPVTPLIAEELWERRGRGYSIHQQPWPVADPALVAADTLELPVQVDGKLRDRLVVTPDTPAEEIERMALASEHVQRYLGGRAPLRVVQIPGRLVNVVTPKG